MFVASHHTIGRKEKENNLSGDIGQPRECLAATFYFLVRNYSGHSSCQLSL